MAKKNKTIQMPSPENYIRTRARGLKIFECLINENWEESGLANVMVSRKHTNGNLTVGVYLVDLFCLGVKDSMYMFNISEQSYREKHVDSFYSGGITRIDYELAHNIIFAAIEFAGDYDFEPHKTFSSVTQYLLEEDTDDIGYIDIKCGINGKPTYFQGPNDNAAMANRIIKQLERTAGKDNFNYTSGTDNSHNISDIDFHNGEFEDDGIENKYSLKEPIKTFVKYENRYDDLNDDEYIIFMDAVTEIFVSITVSEAQREYYEKFSKDLNMEIEVENLPFEILGIPLSDMVNAQAIKDRVWALMTMKEESKKTSKKLMELKRDFENVPFICFLELFFEKNSNTPTFEKNLKQYSRQFPEYPLIRILALIHSFEVDPQSCKGGEIIPLREFFPGRKSLFMLEMQEYLLYALLMITASGNPVLQSGFDDAFTELEFPKEIKSIVFPMLTSARIVIVQTYINQLKQN